MIIKNHRLFEDDNTPVNFLPSPNKSNRPLQPRFLVMHYTAGRNAESSIDWLRTPRAKASAHIVIAKDGTITQLVPFNQIAWHAGESSWNGLRNLNPYSIGIELDNAGRLHRHSNGWRTLFEDRTLPAEEVLVARHKHEQEEAGWHLYSNEQIEAALNVSALLHEKYHFQEVLGHDDISPIRKQDPGPAFPMESFRSKVLGRHESSSPILVTTANLNIRTGPGAEYQALAEGPLPPGTRVEILRSNHPTWRFVDVLDEINGIFGIQGWIHGRYIAEQ